MAESTIVTLASGGSFGTISNPSFSFWNAWNTSAVHNSMVTSSGDEVKTAPKAEVAFDFTKLTTRIVSSSSGSVTFTFRKGLADGNNTIAVTSGQTGTFRDTSHTDSMTSTDTYDLKGVTGASGFFRLAGSSGVATTSGQIHSHLVTQGQHNPSSNVTRYFPFGGELNTALNATEANCKIRSIDTCTLSKLQVYLSSNNNTATVRTRKNGADGGQTISISSSATGFFEDASGTDSIGNGDDFCGQIVAVGSVVIQYSAVNCTSSTSGRSVIVNAGTSGALSSTTTYAGIGGPVYEGTGLTEANAYTVSPLAVNIAGASVYVNTNSVSVAVTHKFRKNAANSGPSISITSSTTGAFSDTTQTFVAVDDLLAYQTVIGGTGSITYSSATLLIESGATLTSTLGSLTSSSAASVIVGGALASTLVPLGNSSVIEVEITSGITFTASPAYAGYAYDGLTSGGAGMRDGIYNVPSFPLQSVYGTQSAANTFIQADLGADTSVSSISLAAIANAHPHGWGPSYTNSHSLQYATAAAPTTWINLVSNITGVVNAATKNFPFTPVTGRYFRIWISSGYTALSEFRIYTQNTAGAGMTLVAQNPVTGTFSGTLSTLTKSLVGTVLDNAALSKSLGTATLSGVGTISITGSLSKTLNALTLSGVGTVVVGGALGKTLSAATLSSAAVVDVTGTLNSSLASATLTSAATISLSGILTVALAALALSGTGEILNGGALSYALENLTGTVSASNDIAADLAGTFSALTLSASGSVLDGGALSYTLEDLVGAAEASAYTPIDLNSVLDAVSGTLTIDSLVAGALTSELDSTSLLSAGELVVGAVVSQSLNPLLISAEGAVISDLYLLRTLDSATAESTAEIGILGSAGVLLENQSLSSTADVSLSGYFSQALFSLQGVLLSEAINNLTLTQTLESFSVLSFVDSSMEAVMDSMTGILVLDSSGTISTGGQLLVTLESLASSALAGVSVLGSLTGSLSDLSLAGVAERISTGTLVCLMDDVSLRSWVFDHRRRVVSTVFGLQRTIDRL